MAKNYKQYMSDGSTKGIRGEPAGYFAIIAGALLHIPTGRIIPCGDHDPQALAKHLNVACKSALGSASSLDLGDVVPEHVRDSVRTAVRSFTTT